MRILTLIILTVVFVAPLQVWAQDGATQITDASYAFHRNPTWSPDGTQIAFQSDDISVFGTTTRMVPATGGPATTLYYGYGLSPAWSPSGDLIAFSTWTGISVVSPLGGSATQITYDPSLYVEPCWSPDGSQIAFASTSIRQWGLRVMPITGGSSQRITTGRHPSWSPDGDQIAFESDRSGGWNIWVTRVPAQNPSLPPTQLTVHGGIHPSWSPDGSQIAFASNRVGRWNIWTMPASGGIATQITTDGGMEPCWSPDGSQIAFSSTRIYETSSCIWVIPVSGATALDRQSWGATKSRFRE